MKTVRFFGAILLMAAGMNTAYAQNAAGEYDPFKHYSRAMGVLIGWGGASMAAGIPMMFSEDPWVKRIGSQNLLWGGIDVAIGVGALALHRRSLESTSREKKISSFRNTMVINGLLDVAYITGGILMTRLSDTVRIRATGVGFVIQGSFLLAFDWANYGLTFRGQ